MNFDITYEGRTTIGVDYAGAIDLRYPVAAVGAALKRAAKKELAAFADMYRARLASTSAGKLAEYRIKEGIALDPASASDAELALIDREAVARGLDRNGLLGRISAQAAAFRQIALLIGAIEAEVGASIDAVANDADDLEDQIVAVLAAAQVTAQDAFAAAQALLAG